MQLLYHYTDHAGLDGILQSGVLWPSTAASSPRDIRYGDGQYMTDIRPGTMTLAQLSRALIGHPFHGKRFAHYAAIDVTGLNVIQGRPGVFVVPNQQPLDIRGRLVRSGVN